LEQAILKGYRSLSADLISIVRLIEC